MARIDAKIITDGNSTPFSSLDTFAVAVCRPPAFTGGTADTRGDNGGTNDPYTLFTVTGDVLVRIFGVCTTDLAGATATLEVGLTGNTAALIAQTTATDIDVNDIWNDTAPTVGTDTLANITGPHVIVNGLDIIETVGTADITSGNVYYICLWRPLVQVTSADGTDLTGKVVAAGTQI